MQHLLTAGLSLLAAASLAAASGAGRPDPCRWPEQRPIFETAPRELLRVEEVERRRCEGQPEKIRPDAGVHYFGAEPGSPARVLVEVHAERCLELSVPDYPHRLLRARWVNPKLIYLEVFFNPHYGAYWIFDVEKQAAVAYELQNDGWDAFVQCHGYPGEPQAGAGESAGD